MTCLDRHEKGLLEALSGRLRHQSQVIEIGAGDGSSALYLKKLLPNADVLAVEALASTYRDLERNCKNQGIGTRKVTVSNVTSSPSFIGSLELGSTTTLDELTSSFEHIDLLKISTANLGAGTVLKSRKTLAKTSILTVPAAMHLLAPERKAGHRTGHLLQALIDKLAFPFVYCFIDEADLVQIDQVVDFADALDGTDGESTLVLSRAPIPAITLQGYLFKRMR
jgi:hypothetical protein